MKTTEVNWVKEKDLDVVHGRYTDKQFKMLNPGDNDIIIMRILLIMMMIAKSENY